MTTLPDNRLRFPTPKIDFTNDVGITGQDHDNYPLPQGQARFDYLRMVMISLLAQQSSFSAPTQYRDGTPWFDLNTLTLKIRKGNAWVSYADVIGLTEPDTNGNVTTLAEWYAAVSDTLVSLAPEVVFSGKCTASGISNITIPTSLQSPLTTDSRVFLYINGSLVDPHNCSLVGTPPTTIRLSGVVLSSGDAFVVSIRRVSAATYLPTTIVIP
jgi:hypothetical protein